EEVFEKFRGNVFVNWIFARQFKRNAHEVERKHSHPTGAVALLKPRAAGKLLAAIEHADVVEPEKSALENIVAFGVLAIHPPGKCDEHLVENRFQKCAVALASLF